MANKKELPGTIMSNKAEMVPDIEQIKNAYFNMKMTFIVCYIATQNDLGGSYFKNKQQRRIMM